MVRPAGPAARRLLPALALAAVLSTPVAAANRDLDEGWLLPDADSAALCRGGGAVRPRGAWARLGAGRLYGMPELPLSQAEAGATFAGLGLSLGWHRLGDGLYREDRLRLALEIPGAPTLRVAGGWDAVRVGDDETRRGAGELALVLAPWPGATLSLRRRLGEPPPWHGGAGRYPLASLAWRGGGRAAVLAADGQTEGPLRLQAELWARVGAGAALGWRLDPATGSIGWTSALGRGRLLLRSSHLVHPELGVSHRWQLCVAAGGEGP